MKSSPLAQVKERFGDKAKLVAAVQSLATDALWLDRLNESKGLAKVSNAKLLKLHAALSQAKDGFGSRAQLVDAIVKLEGRADATYKESLTAGSLPRLLARHAQLSRPSAKASPAKASPAKAAPAKAPPAAKAPEKAAARAKKSTPAA